MLDDKERTRLREGLASAETRVELVLRKGEGEDPLGPLLQDLVSVVEEAGAGAVRVTEGGPPGLPTGPSLTLGNTRQGNIHYLALPEGLEAAPFVDVVLALAQGSAPAGAPLVRALGALERDAELLVFVSAACPHCARSVRAAHEVALACPRVTVIVVDAQRFEVLSARYEVRSVPVTLVDRELALSGSTSAGELAEQLLERGHPGYGTRVLVSLLETNRIDDAARRVLEANGAAEFVEAWRRSAMSLRMGLMLLAGQVLETDARALDGIVDDLLPALDAEDAGLRGDTADLLGQIGHPGALGALAARANDPNADVAEIVADAIEQIRRNE